MLTICIVDGPDGRARKTQLPPGRAALDNRPMPHSWIGARALVFACSSAVRCGGSRPVSGPFAAAQTGKGPRRSPTICGRPAAPKRHRPFEPGVQAEAAKGRTVSRFAATQGNSSQADKSLPRRHQPATLRPSQFLPTVRKSSRLGYLRQTQLLPALNRRVGLLFLASALETHP
jgi:hypothetical protein